MPVEVGPLPEQLEGTWEWGASIGGYGGDTITPARLGREFAVEFTPDGGYREYSGNVLLVSAGYSIELGFAFNTGRRPVVLIRPDTTALFHYLTADDEYAIEAIGPDTLVLLGLSSEARYHRFLRRAGTSGTRR